MSSRSGSIAPSVACLTAQQIWQLQILSEWFMCRTPLQTHASRPFPGCCIIHTTHAILRTRQLIDDVIECVLDFLPTHVSLDFLRDPLPERYQAIQCNMTMHCNRLMFGVNFKRAHTIQELHEAWVDYSSSFSSQAHDAAFETVYAQCCAPCTMRDRTKLPQYWYDAKHPMRRRALRTALHHVTRCTEEHDDLPLLYAYRKSRKRFAVYRASAEKGESLAIVRYLGVAEYSVSLRDPFTRYLSQCGFVQFRHFAKEPDADMPVQELRACFRFDHDHSPTDELRDQCDLIQASCPPAASVPPRAPRLVAQEVINRIDAHALVLQNVQPLWNTGIDAYALMFCGGRRVRDKSSRNARVVQWHSLQSSDSVWQFGRYADSQWSVDFARPLSPLLAFSLALANWSRRAFVDET